MPHATSETQRALLEELGSCIKSLAAVIARDGGDVRAFAEEIYAIAKNEGVRTARPAPRTPPGPVNLTLRQRDSGFFQRKTG